MTECDHCPGTFVEEKEYLNHLTEKHPENLGRIDRRRIEEHPEVSLGESYTTEKLILQGIIIVAVVGGLLGLLYLLFTTGLYEQAMAASVISPVIGLF